MIGWSARNSEITIIQNYYREDMSVSHCFSYDLDVGSLLHRILSLYNRDHSQYMLVNIPSKFPSAVRILSVSLLASDVETLIACGGAPTVIIAETINIQLVYTFLIYL